MTNPQMVMYEEEYQQISQVIDRLNRDAKCEGLLPRGQKRSADCERRRYNRYRWNEFGFPDRQEILRQQVGWQNFWGRVSFSIVFHEGEKDNIHISLIGQRVILVVCI